MNKHVLTLMVIHLFLALGVQAQRTIKTEGKTTLLVEPDEIGANFQISSESERSTGVKMSLSKIEEQLRNQLSKNNISASKLEIGNDPKLCNATSKNCMLTKLTYEEYNKLKPFLKKNIFISNFMSNYKISKKEDIAKYTEQLLKMAYDDSRAKAEIIASNMNEKLGAVQSIINPLFIEDYPLQLEKNYLTNLMRQYKAEGIAQSNDFDVEKLELYAVMIVEYNLEGMKSNAPRYIQIDALSEKKIPYQNAHFGFTLKIEDYEEGDPAKLIEGLKAEITALVTKAGVNHADINMNDIPEEIGATYQFQVKGEQNIQTLHNALSANKNVTNLTVNEKEEAQNKYESELIVKVMDNSRDKIKILERATGLKTGKILDVNLYGESTLTTNLILLTQSSLKTAMAGREYDEMVQDEMRGVKKLEKKKYKIAIIKHELQ